MYKYLALSLLILVCVPGALSIHSPHRASNADAAETAVLRAESQKVQAMLKADVAGLRAILSDDLVYTHSTARVDDKASFIESIRSGELKYEAMDHRDVKVRFYGDAAILTGQSSVRVSAPKATPPQQSFELRFTSVYYKTPSGWKQVSWQSTRIPPAAN